MNEDSDQLPFKNLEDEGYERVVVERELARAQKSKAELRLVGSCASNNSCRNSGARAPGSNVG
jgi:hypothetical protein